MIKFKNNDNYLENELLIIKTLDHNTFIKTFKRQN